MKAGKGARSRWAAALGRRRAWTTGAALIGATASYAAAVAWCKVLPLYDCVVLVPLLAAEFWALERLGPARPSFATATPFPDAAHLRATVLFATSAVLCGAFLVRLWTLGYEGRNAVFGGILPWSDSADFESDALRLVHGARFSPASSRRPLFIALLATLLRAGGGNLRVAIAVLTAISAAAMTLPALEVWRTHGYRSAFVVYVVFVFFERRWTGFIQTEHLGLPLGALGFALLWRASAGRRGPSASTGPVAVGIAVGIFSIALGLFARAGCFFVLPMLAAWGAALAPPSRRLAAFAGFLASAGLALGLHEAVLLATANGSSFSDYPPIFYGLLHGRDFTWMTEAYPWLAARPPSERVLDEWRIIADELARAPWLLPLGLGRSLVSFVTSPFGLFSYVWTNPDDRIFEDGERIRTLWQSGGIGAVLAYWRRCLGAFSIVNTVAMGALGAGFVVAFTMGAIRILRGWRATLARPYGPDALLFASTAGILASVPFMPPWITSGMQIQTVTLGFAATTAAVMFREPHPNSPIVMAPGPSSMPSPRIAIFALAAGIALFGLGLMAVRLRPERAPTPHPSPYHWVHVDPSATVEVARDRSMSFRRKALGDLWTSLEFLGKHNPALVASLVPSLRLGTLYHSAYDPGRGAWEILVDEGRALDGVSGWVAVASTPLETAGVEQLLGVNRLAGSTGR